ncbi:sugar ABC transporter permease [Clostridia bacterium]|nr:sugar ABC transporter permease [Clostridia bacterium]
MNRSTELANNNRHRFYAASIRRDWQLYLFLLIPLSYIILFSYVPMGGLQIAFRSFSARKGIWGSKWVGFDNFRKFFGNYYFVRTLKNTLLLSAYSIACGFPIPIIMALLMNCLGSQKYKNAAQAITTLPHFISMVVLVGMLLQIFSARNGLYGILAVKLTGSFPTDLFASPDNFRHFYVWSGVWQEFGWGSIIYIAALAAVDPTLHEAAMIDGASRFRRVIHIDFPAILPTVITLLILRAGSVMSIGFEKVFLMQNNVNLVTSEVISTYVYKMGLSAGGAADFSYSTAIGFFNSVVNMILIVTVNFISGKLSDSNLW